jgi:uncharacterized protein
MKRISSTKLEQLIKILKNMKNVAIAFSGGVDSTFLLKVAKETLKDKVVAITVISPLFPYWEKEEVKKFSKENNIDLILINEKKIDKKIFLKNSNNRCYYCKKNLFSQILKKANEKNIKYVLDASNIDDLNDYRPGMKAIKELKIRQPLIEAGFSKKEIREFSKKKKLYTWNKPSFACLASRFPYGIKITKSRLKQIENTESYLRKLGFTQFRVRYHNEIARIEVLETEFNIILRNSKDIIKIFKKFGFKYITLDIQGYRAGSTNEVL